MKKIELTQGMFALIDDEDYENLSQWKWYYHYGYAKSTNKQGRQISMSRVILNAPKGIEVDHINRDTLNNQRSNLRLVTKAQNGWNRKVISTINTSGYKGVHIEKRNKFRKYVARIQVNKKRLLLGYYLTAEEAAKDYDKAAIELFGDFARLNFSNK